MGYWYLELSLMCVTVQKQEPDYNFVLPHKDPLKCPIVALAILLHYQFDQEGLIDRIDGWDWSCAPTWRKVSDQMYPSMGSAAEVGNKVKLMFGRVVGQPSSGDALRKMYTAMLEPTTITSKKKLHLARRTMPTMMEDMGYVLHTVLA